MKTAERILLTSLTLFNQHGEHNVTSVDIALELDISPGNLYYHFKGKEEIVAALFDLYRRQLHKLLQAPIGKQLKIEEFFYYLYLLLEKHSLFRFFYRSPADVCESYGAIAKPFERLCSEQDKAIEVLLKDFGQRGLFVGSDAQRQLLLELIGLVMTQSASYYQFRQPAGDQEYQVYQSLSLLLSAGIPYLQLESDELHQLQHAIHEHTLGQLVDVNW